MEVVHEVCGEEWEYSGTFGDAEKAARYGHDSFPVLGGRGAGVIA